MSQQSTPDAQPQTEQPVSNTPAASAPSQPMTIEELASIMREMQKQMDSRIDRLREDFERRFNEMKALTGSPAAEMNPQPEAINTVTSKQLQNDIRELGENTDRSMRELGETLTRNLRDVKDRLSLVEIRAQAALDRSSVASSQGIRRSAFSLDDIASVAQRDHLRRRRPFI